MNAFNLALESFEKNQVGSFKIEKDRYFVVTKNSLVLREYVQNELQQAILAINIKGQLLGNSTRFSNFRGQLLTFQIELAKTMPMIPFEVMKEAGLSLNTYKEIDKGPDETIWRKKITYLSLTEKEFYARPNIKIISHNKSIGSCEYLESEHFTGPRLFQVESSLFLMDIDRNEIQHGIVNPFLVKLKDNTVKTIAEAYESLKPSEVKQAETQLIEVKRQGEWFFIKSSLDLSVNVTKERFILQAGNNRPNYAEVMIEKDNKKYVSGKISHAGREHKDLELAGFYEAIPNTSTESWSITGDID